jgi:hypothetical protein
MEIKRPRDKINYSGRVDLTIYIICVIIDIGNPYLKL